MKIVGIYANAEGYYSEAKYHEAVFLTADTYKAVDHILKTLTLCIWNLDGKHSQVNAEINYEYFDDTEGCNDAISENTGDSLFDSIEDMLSDVEIDLEHEKRLILEDEYHNFTVKTE